MGSPEDTDKGTASSELTEHAFDLFVLHAADDREFVRGYLLPALNLPAQRVLLLDDLPLGAVLVSEIDRGISSSRFTVVVLSPAYLQDRWAVYGEQLAIHVSIEDVHVIPLRLADVKLPHRLDARIALDFTDPARWDAEAARLRGWLRTAPPAIEQLACPYPGMRPFTEHEASRFFGRAKEIMDLVDRLEGHEREIYAIGPSGSGKSSLVHAGLLHVLNSGSSRLGHSFAVRTMRPGDRPTDQLALALDGDLVAPEATIDRLLGRHPIARRVLIIVDQLEELFALADTAEQRRFVATLRAFESDLRCHFLFVLRADFYGALMESELWPARGLTPINVAPLRGVALAQAIVEPATRAGAYLERRLCDRLVADAATEPGALPHVQETLRLLWEARRQRLLGLAEYEALGDGGRGLDTAIARRAEATMRALTAAQRMIARRLMLRLVVFGEGRADTRRQQPIGALRSATDAKPEFSYVLRRLVEDRLITVQRGTRADDVVVDLSHEALITAWPAFRDWIAQTRGEEQVRRRLESKVAEWIERGRGTASLLDPLQLSDAEQWMRSAAAHDLGYSVELPALVAASKRKLDRASQQERRATLRRLLALAVIIVISIFAWKQLQYAKREAGVQRLLEKDRALLVRHPMKVLRDLIAARSDQIDSPALRNLFAQAARATPLLTIVDSCLIETRAVFNPNSTRLVVSCDKTARVWDAMTGVPLSPALEHPRTVRTLAFSPDGTHIVTTSDDNVVRVWDARTGDLVAATLEHPRTVVAAAFSPDGTRIVTASGNERLRRDPPRLHYGMDQTTADISRNSEPSPSGPDVTTEWDAATGGLKILPLEHLYAVTAAVFSPDTTRVVTLNAHGTARMWDIASGKQMHPLAYSLDIIAATFSPDGARLITASAYGTAEVWDVTTGEQLTSLLNNHGMLTAAAAFSPDGTRVVTMSKENRARLWIGAGGSMSASLEHEDVVTGAAFSPDGTRVVTASDDGTARVWDAETGNPVTLPLEHTRRVTMATFSPDSTRVVTASEDGTVRVWNATPTTLKHQHSVVTAAFSRDGGRVVIAGEDRTVRVWNTTTGKPVTAPFEHQGDVISAAFSPDGRYVVTASEDGTAHLWNTVNSQPVAAPLEHHGVVTSAAFSPDGRHVMTTSEDGTARLWNAANGELMMAFNHQDTVTAAVFSGSGRQIVTASKDRTARIWDLTTKPPVVRSLPHDRPVTIVVFSHDGTRIVTGSEDGTARIWDAVTGHQLVVLNHHSIVTNAVFSPNDTRVVTACKDGTTQLWDVATGEPLSRTLTRDGPVVTVAFSADGARMVTVGRDSTAWVWDTRTGEPLVMLDHQNFITATAFSADGTRVVTAGQDGIARIWDLSIALGSLADWKQFLSCTSFTFVAGEPWQGPRHASVCPPH